MAEGIFIHEDFLLEGDWARRLYHGHVEQLPIIDYHCHLPADQIAEQHEFRSMTELWLDGDHYKWRAMRAAGVDERFLTGDASDWEKFRAWATVVPKTLRNPLYHWTHLEMARPFGINELLGPENARSVYDRCNEKLSTPEFSAPGILKQFRVEVVCTTDDPVDELRPHLQHRKSGSTLRLLPTFRPDAAMALAEPRQYRAYLERLGEVSGVEVNSFEALVEALAIRHEYFHEAGCRLSDHGLDQPYSWDEDAKTLEAIFDRARRGQRCSPEEVAVFKSALLLELAKMDHARGWVQQLHIGALRDNNTRMFRAIGQNTGFDSIDDQPMARPLGRFLDELDETGQLAKTILYNLNPRDNEVLATMAGNFQEGPTPGKIQFGAAWWFLDQLDGMEKQLNALSNLGLLSGFVGMLTDSRSFVSYSRHEYFRRLLCNMIGSDVQRGRLPADEGLLGGLVRDVCYENAKRYFGFYD